MSLLVWLPLNGDLHNQGCGNVTITANAGEAYYNNGKIGKAFNLNKRITFNCPQLNGLSTFSITFWGQPMTSSTLTTNWQDLLGFTDVATSGTTGQFRFETCYNYAAGNGVHWHDNATNAIVNGSWTGPAEKGTWHHYAVIVKKNEYIKTYFDGILQSTITTNLYGGYLNGQFWIGETNNIEGMINDVRVYNHCLSAAEVHEIAQGLILHYKLDGPMGGSGINLLRGSNQIGSSGVYGWINNGGSSNFSIEKIDNNTLHFKGTPNNNKSIPSITTNTVAPCEWGKTYTYQMELKFDKDIKLGNNVPMHDWPGARQNNVITETSINGHANGYSISYVQGYGNVTLPANTWQKIISKITFPASAPDASYPYPAIRAFVYGSVLLEDTNTEVNVWMRNCKIEEGTVATTWSPAPEDVSMDITKIEDSSGYNNNAISNGSVALTYSPDTPRYNLSTQFASGARIMSPMAANAFLPTDAMTVNIWFKSTNPSNRFISCTEGGGWNFEVASGKVRFSVYVKGKGYELNQGNTTWSSLGDDKWHMLTGVYDRTYSKIYIDGELDNTFTLANPGLDIGYNAGAVPFCLGAEARTISSPIAGTYVGNLSDLRIYCTPLLDIDIKMLYNTSMRIDNLGGTHAYAFEEKASHWINRGQSAFGANSANAVKTIISSSEVEFFMPANASNYRGLLYPESNRSVSNYDIALNWGDTLVFEFEAKCDKAVTVYYDYNEWPINNPSGWSGNDNTNNRTTSTIALSPNVWTRCCFRSTNLNETKNPNHYPLYDYSYVGIYAHTEDCTIRFRNPIAYILQNGSMQIKKSGIVSHNDFTESDIKNYASINDKSKNIYATNFIEK